MYKLNIRVGSFLNSHLNFYPRVISKLVIKKIIFIVRGVLLDFGINLLTKFAINPGIPPPYLFVKKHHEIKRG